MQVGYLNIGLGVCIIFSLVPLEVSLVGMYAVHICHQGVTTYASIYLPACASSDFDNRGCHHHLTMPFEMNS